MTGIRASQKEKDLSRLLYLYWLMFSNCEKRLLRLNKKNGMRSTKEYIFRQCEILGSIFKTFFSRRILVEKVPEYYSFF